VTLGLERSLEESVFASNAFYVTTIAALSVEHQLRPRLSVRAAVNVAMNDYPNQETVGGETKFRDDWIYGAGAGIDYELFRWMRLGLQYNYEQRDSNFAAFDFTDHRGIFTVTFQY
jgi:uncharacterized protein (PEP-CTERM system associated)